MSGLSLLTGAAVPANELSLFICPTSPAHFLSTFGNL